MILAGDDLFGPVAGLGPQVPDHVPMVPAGLSFWRGICRVRIHQAGNAEWAPVSAREYSVDQGPKVTTPLRRATHGDDVHNVVAFTIPAGSLPPGNDHNVFASYHGSDRYEPNSVFQHRFEVGLVSTLETTVVPEHPTVGQEAVVTVHVGLRDQPAPPTPPTPTGTVQLWANEKTCRVVEHGDGGLAVRGIAGGSCAVTAQQPGDDAYEPADDVVRFASVAKRAQRISFPALPDLVVGHTVVLRATADSGLTVSYRSETPRACGVRGTQLVAVAEGPCEVVASQAGNQQWQAAGERSRATLVIRRSQTITVNRPPSGLVGQVVTVKATATSGLPVSLKSTTTNVCTAGGGRVTLAAGGTCRLRASQPGNATWDAADSVDVAVTVARRAQRLTFPRPRDGKVGRRRTLRATSSAGLPVQYLVGSRGICKVTGRTVRLRAPGRCRITARQPGSARYGAADPVTVAFRVGR